MLAQRPRACVARAIAGAARSGSIKLIAVASAKRLAEFPDVPTVAETIPGFQATGWGVLVAPVGTSEAIIDKISQDLRKVSLDPGFRRDRAQVLTFRTKAWSSFAPPTCRMPLGQSQASPELIPEEGSSPGFGIA